jgi:hypothetical protein
MMIGDKDILEEAAGYSLFDETKEVVLRSRIGVNGRYSDRVNNVLNQ